MFDSGSFGVDESAVVGLGGNGDGGAEEVREGAQFIRPLADVVGPFFVIEGDFRGGLSVGVGFFFGEVGGLVAVGGFDLLVGFDPDEAFGGGAVDAVGIEPHAGLDGGGRVVDGDGGGGGELDSVTADTAVVVEFGVADAEGDVEVAVVGSELGVYVPEGGTYLVGFNVRDFIGEVVRRGVAL